MSSRVFALAGIAALLALQLLWHGIWMPPRSISPWLYALFFCLPLAPALWLALRRRNTAAFAGALAVLLYFCHGVMEAMSTPAERSLAMAEIALSIWVIMAYSWPGLRGRFRKTVAMEKENGSR
jgi:uncharacterized membrane protein